MCLHGTSEGLYIIIITWPSVSVVLSYCREFYMYLCACVFSNSLFLLFSLYSAYLHNLSVRADEFLMRQCDESGDTVCFLIF